VPAAGDPTPPRANEAEPGGRRDFVARSTYAPASVADQTLMQADSAFIRRLTIVRDHGEAWSARLRSTSARRDGLGTSVARLLIAIPVMVVVGLVLLVALTFAIAFGVVAIAIGVAVAAARWVRRTLGLASLPRRDVAADHPGRVNVRVIRRS
jgi:hypothetical protein